MHHTPLLIVNTEHSWVLHTVYIQVLSRSLHRHTQPCYHHHLLSIYHHSGMGWAYRDLLSVLVGKKAKMTYTGTSIMDLHDLLQFLPIKGREHKQEKSALPLLPMLHVPPFWQGLLVTQMCTGTHLPQAEFCSYPRGHERMHSAGGQ